MAIAHTKNVLGNRQDLLDHLTNVAERAAAFATRYEAAELARLAGLLHDIGKFNPAFQQYLLAAEGQPRGSTRGPDHKGAGARLAEMAAPELLKAILAFIIAGHHGGLSDFSALKDWLRERGADPAIPTAIATAQLAIPQLGAFPSLSYPLYIQTVQDSELFTRMLFSALVDADFLDTEQHFTGGKTGGRGVYPRLDTLERQFERNQHALTGQAHDQVNVIRHEVYQACRAAAALPPGFFRLTVPTGGGKTRSSLAFALRHALTHGLSRVIYAIPYTSITEQTASEFRTIFSNKRAVLEHHSALPSFEDASLPTAGQVWMRLAAENWDAPLIVTTTVQLFESLMARTPSACRKLHNIAGSVVILDEAQTLPTKLLTPILDVLRALVANYHVTVVLCTATQPALDSAQSGFQRLENIREIVPEPERFFVALKRVTYAAPQADEQWSWGQVAEHIRKERQALAIVNTRADAVALLDALDDPDALHLSTWMCGAHRRAVLDEVRRRLAQGEPCRLISTQVIEAGVDVDFPVVLRAMGPLDSIVQAAGRCNRNGRLAELGRVIVFQPEEGKLPPGSYRTGTDISHNFMQVAEFDFHDPAMYRRYFEDFYTRSTLTRTAFSSCAPPTGSRRWQRSFA